MDRMKNNGGKITLGMLKGKPITSSVPSLAIRFNATAEEIEELYLSEGEQHDTVSESITTTSDVEESPSRSNKFSRRSASIEVSQGTDASPPSDPWRFFTDIKGKITKSVEGKIIEYKSRTNEGEGSPKTSKNNKEGSSLSDSEELSESSISKTCGIMSTTEGAEMSSDDETPSLSEKEKKRESELEQPTGLRRRAKIVKNKDVKAETMVSSRFLENLKNINMGLQDSQEDVESGIDCLLQLDNVEIDASGDILIKQLTGNELSGRDLTSPEMTVLAPMGYVDMRTPEEDNSWRNTAYGKSIVALIALTLYFVLPLSPYIYGYIAGSVVMFFGCFLYISVFCSYKSMGSHTAHRPIVEIAPVEEHQPLVKYEGWVNEYPEKYDPQTYHISQTQSVYLKLQGNLLKISHTRSKIPKRAMFNEPEHKHSFIKHRIYNLLGAKVTLLPTGLTKIRHWSKKYPICITLDKDQYNFDYLLEKRDENSSPEENDITDNSSKKKDLKKTVQPQIYSKLCEEGKDLDANLTDNDNEEINSPVLLINDVLEPSDPDIDNDLSSTVDPQDYIPDDDMINISSDDWSLQVEDSTQTALYVFARTDREKEHWYRRLTAATHRNTNDLEKKTSEMIKASQLLNSEYLKFMSKFLNASNNNEQNPSEEINWDSVWVNALMSRFIFDLAKNATFTARIKDRIQRKLSAIKLPYFIEELTITELSLGNSSPVIRKAEKPLVDERGLWVDLDIHYEGHVLVILQTKLNLMKLKQPQGHAAKKLVAKSPIFHSDVDDTAESSSDEDIPAPIPVQLDTVGNAGNSTKSKRLIRMVDRIAESRIFQAATENKYIKKAIEGVSNTDLGLKVELKSIEGCLVLNIPSPPSDRVWVGFRPSPKIQLTAQPNVGERNISFLHVTNWIEKRLYKEFQKILVIPNMEDLQIPVMLQQLPE